MTTTEILALSLMPAISATTIRGVAELGRPMEWLTRITPDELAHIGLRRGAIDAMRDVAEYLELAERQLERAMECGGRVVDFWDDSYPAALRQIYAPPVIIFVLGDLCPEDGEGVAVVGTRVASMYGRLAAERYSAELASAGVTVTSGLARGIDSYAHASAIAAGGRTVAVIASGLNRISPAPAERLAEQIAGHGAVVSEQAFDVRAMPAYFPQRNRIISGLSRGTLVVESDLRGGSMITAGFALDQGREVFALPGPITSPKSRGPNELIRTDRARLTQSPSDMMESLGILIPAAGPIGANGLQKEALTMFEASIYEAIGGDPLHIDEICESTRLSSSEVLVGLLSLEFKGLVRQMSGRMFLRRQ